ncbi:C4-dicarboxylate ABC transporter substrate-binding protein [Devosia yakushimensis]|uniref:C4-dicarboxylate ABC transporter substrate-binding protein n=2 Tax=Devosia yakushimensis TaxID=470028 RepID=A0ABQ5UFC2_9HYPH|nr:C4-dicarboxylate ABC transporter substrate-binding protein [Devosia yakushimensis]
MLGLAGALFSALPALAQTTLNLSDVLPETNFMVQNAAHFAQEVSAATDGQVTISIKAGGSLGFKGPDQLTAVRDGLVDMADINISQQVGVNPLFGVEGVPFLVSSMDELKKYHEFVRPAFVKIAEENNQKLLYMVPSPAQYVYLKVPVDSIDDFSGIPVRGADKNTVDVVSAIGMAGVAMPWGELIPALASGRVEGVATSATSGVDGKFWEFMKYIYPTNHTWGSNMVTINLDSWNRLSADQQAAIEEVASRLEPEFWEVSRQGDIDSIKIMQENGMELATISDELRTQMVERAQQLQADFVARVPDAGPIVDQYKATQ